MARSFFSVNGQLWFLLLLHLFIPFSSLISQSHFACTYICKLLQSVLIISNCVRTSYIHCVYGDSVILIQLMFGAAITVVVFIHKKNFMRHHQIVWSKTNQKSNEWLYIHYNDQSNEYKNTNSWKIPTVKWFCEYLFIKFYSFARNQIYQRPTGHSVE